MATIRTPSIRLDLGISPEQLAPRIGSWPGAALLESGPGFGESGRFSVFTAWPRLVFEATGQSWAIRDERGGSESGHGGVLETLSRILRRFRLADPAETPDPSAPHFQGGMIGYFGYDLAPLLERLPRKAPCDSNLPDVRFALYDTAFTVDHVQGRVQLGVYDLFEEGPAALERRARAWTSAIARPARAPRASSRFGPLVSNFSKSEYLAAVRRILEYIAAGDVFQVNLSQRFLCRGTVDSLGLYLENRAKSPAPFSSFLKWDDLAVVSASPEWFYQTRGDRIVTRPIKGTRPRGTTREADGRLRAELAGSPKDRAELTMIVDLERNDLGRVCQYGSVRVVEPLSVESFAQVHHLVATVEGQVRPGVGALEIVRAMFPGGSVTGAPKIRAMEIIDELEPTRRGLYTGSIGYFSRGGSSAFNIAIRTIVVEGDRVSFQVGGGIVADSDPESEYHETLHKGRGMREVIEAFSRE